MQSHMQPLKLASTFVVVNPNLSSVPVDVGPTLYQELDRDFSQFNRCLLVAEYTFEQDWPSWEMHPAGDEILYLISGRVEMRLYNDGQEYSVQFQEPGSSIIIPKGHWHTARVLEKAKILFITPGEGTQNVTDPRVPNA